MTTYRIVFVLLTVYLSISVNGFTPSPLFQSLTKIHTHDTSNQAIELKTDDNDVTQDRILEEIVMDRYACKYFQRYDGNESAETASASDPNVVEIALKSLELAQQAPSSFNTQPYKIVLVHTPEQKQALSKYCLGPNQQRVLDSDCTAVFLADRKVTRSFSQFKQLIQQQNAHRPLTHKQLYTLLFYTTIFSSGYPLPRFLSATFSFLFRTAMGFLNVFSTFLLHYPLPSLASAETWASKQTGMVGMVYMLACTSHGLATLPMEGINARGIRELRVAMPFPLLSPRVQLEIHRVVLPAQRVGIQPTKWYLPIDFHPRDDTSNIWMIHIY
jgi:nitroreductase